MEDWAQFENDNYKLKSKNGKLLEELIDHKVKLSALETKNTYNAEKIESNSWEIMLKDS